jgi:hypothetical protein
MKPDFMRDPRLTAALREAQNQNTDALLERATGGGHAFSPAFERSMARLIKAQRRPGHALVSTRPRRAVLALAAVLVLMTSLMLTVSALREPVLRLIIVAQEKYSDVSYDNTENLPNTLETLYAPAKLPQGYRLDETQTIDYETFYRLIYCGDGDAEIIYTQIVIAGTRMTIDTEGVETQRVLVGGREGIYYSNKGFQSVIWDDGQYSFSLIGKVTKAQLLRTARSLRAVEGE